MSTRRKCGSVSQERCRDIEEVSVMQDFLQIQWYCFYFQMFWIFLAFPYAEIFLLQKAASSSGDMTIKIWSLEDKTCLQTLNGHNSAVFRVCGLAFVQQFWLAVVS